MLIMIPGLDGLRGVAFLLDMKKSLTSLTATLLAASLSYSLLELPILDLKDRFFPLKQSKKQENVLAATVEL